MSDALCAQELRAFEDHKLIDRPRGPRCARRVSKNNANWISADGAALYYICTRPYQRRAHRGRRELRAQHSVAFRFCIHPHPGAE